MDEEFDAVQRYTELDLSPSSPAAEHLMAGVADEAHRKNIKLTSDGDDVCSGITPAMSSWVGSYVSPLRQSAMAELLTASRRIKIGKNTDGVLLEKERSDADREHGLRRSQLYGAFHDQNGDVLRDYDHADSEYDHMRTMEGSRDAKMPNPWVEWGVLFPLILIPESLLNFESFRNAPIIGSDAMALGITILVGLAIAVAAHLLGSFSKQFNFYMRPDDEKSKGDGFRKWSIGIALLTAALAAVGSARYYYLVPLAAQAEILGQEPPNIVVQLGGSLIGNIVVFLIGAAFTFLLHDRNPLFTEKRVRLEKAKREVARLRRGLDERLSEVEMARKRTVDESTVLSKQMNSKPGYDELRGAFNRLQAKDAEAIALLSTYKSRLVSEIERKNPEFSFEKNVLGADRGGENVKVSLSTFAAAGVRLCY